MSAGEYETMRRAEDGHWWYRTLRDLVAKALAEAATPGMRLLDAGCGTGGGPVRWRRELGLRHCYGVDLAPEAIAHTRARGGTLVARSRVDALPFGDGSFDAVVSLDVLCIAGVDDDRALAEFHRVLRPQGLLVLNLPAFESLRGQHDRAVNIGHRYVKGEVEAKLDAAGFTVVRSFYWDAVLFGVAWLLRRLRSGRSASSASSDLFALPRPLDAALTMLMRWEGKLPRTRLPFGTSVLSIARAA